VTAHEPRSQAPAATEAQAVWLVIGGIVSVQVGAAIAKDLFPLIPPTAMVWLRLVTSALILVAIARPRLRGRSAADWRMALGFGSEPGDDELGDLPVVRRIRSASR
jgi:inner membrane transporter RhtA